MHEMLFRLFMMHNDAGLWASQAIYSENYDGSIIPFMKQRGLLRDATLLDILLCNAVREQYNMMPVSFED